MPPVLLPSAGSPLQSYCLHPAPSPSPPSCLETDPHFNFKERKRKGKAVDWAFCTAKQIRGLPGTCSLCSEEARAGRQREGGEAPLSSAASEIQTCLWSIPYKFYFVHLPSLPPHCPPYPPLPPLSSAPLHTVDQHFEDQDLFSSCNGFNS